MAQRFKLCVLAAVLVLGMTPNAHAEEQAGVLTGAARTTAVVLWIVGGVVSAVGVAQMAAAGGVTAGAVALGNSQGESVGFTLGGRGFTGIPGLLLAGSVPIAVMGGLGLLIALLGAGMITTGVVLRILF